MSDRREISREEWVELVVDMLARHPDWTASTVNAIQAGVVEAIERERDRVVKLSWGLHQALSSTRKAKRRNRKMIVEAIEVSMMHPTVWSAAMIAKESE